MSVGILLRRLGGAGAALLISSFLVFGALYAAPGDPISVLLGGRTTDPRTVAALRHTYHLDQPFWHRYVSWLWGVLHGDFGHSMVFNEPASSVIGPRVATTLLLTAYAAVLICLFGLLIGVIGAVVRPSASTAVLTATTVGVGIPSFVAAIVMISVFGVDLRWFPVFGGGSGLADRLYHLTMPAIALALAATALLARVTRAALREELVKDHVLTARSRGVPPLTVLRRHVLRNGAMPIVTVTGLMVGALAAGTVVVDNAFSLNGLGLLLIQSVTAHDFAVVQGICLLFVVVVVVVNTLVDLLYLVLDPRTRSAVAR